MATKNDDAVQYNGEDLKQFNFPNKFDHRQSAVPGNPCYNFRFRIFIFFTYIVITQLGEIFGTPSDNVDGIWDWGHLLTTPVNKLYQDHRWFSAMMQISSAFILDFAFFYVSLYWVLYERNFRLFAVLILFYAIRAVHLNIFKLEYSPNYYWEDPLVPSLVVKYGKYSDFFYSGHVGFLTICALEMKKVGKNYMALFFFICSIFQAFIVISFAIHYTIDVPGGYIFSHYFFNMVCYWEAKIDFILKRMADCFSRTNKTIRIDYENDTDKQQPTAI
ncbi:unnamed protein product [Paramecium sonneborni]|uniref:AtPDCT1/2 transmembrane domain-containing protein n=1 Tax=Paramecium sonneborni TaxID=65129 RepID=A0A8S1MTJ0_9CILI|nr:unnamed protein product [Paramecium sonneborni]